MAACRIILTNKWAELPTEHHQRCSKLVCSTSEARLWLVISLISPYQPPPLSPCHSLSPTLIMMPSEPRGAGWLDNLILSLNAEANIDWNFSNFPACKYAQLFTKAASTILPYSAVFSMQHINDLTSGIFSRLFLTLDDCDEDVESWRYDTFIFR